MAARDRTLRVGPSVPSADGLRRSVARAGELRSRPWATIEILGRATASSLAPCLPRPDNAYYDNDLNAVLFGYFEADEDDPGANLPGQLIFTCLSHDIIAHEVSHAALDSPASLLPGADKPARPSAPRGLCGHRCDLPALHLPEVVRMVIRQTRNGPAAGRKPAARHRSAVRSCVWPAVSRCVESSASLIPRSFAKDARAPPPLGWILVSGNLRGICRNLYEAYARPDPHSDRRKVGACRMASCIPTREQAGDRMRAHGAIGAAHVHPRHGLSARRLIQRSAIFFAQC
jgi:hypothetical protein